MADSMLPGPFEEVVCRHPMAAQGLVWVSSVRVNVERHGRGWLTERPVLNGPGNIGNLFST